MRVLSLDFSKAEREVRLEPAAGATPEESFRKSWALAALENALEGLREEFREPGYYEAIRSHLSAKEDRPSYEELGRRLGLSASGVTNLLHRARKALRERIRSALRETVESESEVDGEVRELFDSL